MKTPSHVFVPVPVKRYMFQWLKKRFDRHFYVNMLTIEGAMLKAALLQRQLKTNERSQPVADEEDLNAQLRMFEDAQPQKVNACCFVFPAKLDNTTWGCYGVEKEQDTCIVLNALWEELFKQDLHEWCKAHTTATGRYHGYNEAIESFAEQYGIQIPEDVSFEGLKRKEKRFREGLTPRRAKA